MSLPQIVALLRETVGLDVASVGASLIERAVKRRVSANGLRDISQYADLLQRSELELQSLFEAVVIPETFFFRYPESFAGLRQIVGERFLFGTQKMRVAERSLLDRRGTLLDRHDFARSGTVPGEVSN